MSHNSRRALFYGLFAVFLILGTGIVLFAEGWRVDFPSFRVSKVGGIYVRAYPEDANIFLNGKPVRNQSGFLAQGTLLSDLFPKTYRLTITAPGYVDWHENATVAPSLVDNHKYAVLVPATSTRAATSTIAEFATSHGSVLLETTRGEILLDGKTIGFGTLVAESPDLQSMIFQTAKGTYEFEDASTETMTDLSNMLTGEGFSTSSPIQISISPFANKTVLVANAKKVALFDMAQFSASEIGAAQMGKVIGSSLALSPSTIAWSSSANTTSSLLFFYDLSSRNIASTTIALTGSIKKLDWITDAILGILTKNGSLYLYDVYQQNLRKIADDVRTMGATADGSRIATLESFSLEIFTPSDPEGYYRFNLPDIADAQTAQWYGDDDHLFIAYPDRAAFLDLQDASLANFITVSSGTAPHYDADANTLYMIDHHKYLLRFDFPK